MAFRTYLTSVASAVATNGTFTFSLANAADWGQSKFEGAHYIYSEGLQRLLSFAAGDFTLSVSGTTVTVTYKGTTSIPAGSVLRIQLSTGGEQNYLFDGKGPLELKERGADYLGNPRWSAGKVVKVDFGAPAAASATAVVNAVARTGTNTLTTYATAVNLDAPRCLQYKSSNAGDTTQTVTARGLDEYGVAITETVTLNGTTAVNGTKAFKTVISDTVSATLVGNLSIGHQNVFGLPFFVQGAGGNGGTGIGNVLKEVADGATPTAGTLAGGDLTIASATTKDVRGVYTPNTTPDGAKNLSIWLSAEDVSFMGMTQFGT
jgi:hypothetical protein